MVFPCRPNIIVLVVILPTFSSIIIMESIAVKYKLQVTSDTCRSSFSISNTYLTLLAFTLFRNSNYNYIKKKCNLNGLLKILLRVMEQIKSNFVFVFIILIIFKFYLESWWAQIDLDRAILLRVLQFITFAYSFRIT